MANKPKLNYAAKPEESQEKDRFYTPKWATRLLLPYIPKGVTSIWECAAGSGRMAKVLAENKAVFSSDIEVNFLSKRFPSDPKFYFDCIITNPPFSLKYDFARKCLEYKVPWALLVPFDICKQMTDLIDLGVQFILPDARVNFITPFLLKNIHEGELFALINKESDIKYKTKAKVPADIWSKYEDEYPLLCLYQSVDEAPVRLVQKYSAAQFHSTWMTYGFNLPKQINTVHVTKEMKEDV